MAEVSKDTKALPGSDNQKLRDFYLIAIDSTKADKDGIKPISADLAAIDLIKTKNELLKMVASLGKKGVSAMVGFYVYSDFKNSNANTCYLAQSGIGLPDKDFYFEPQYESVKKEYMDHIGRMFECLGNYPESAKINASIVMKIETELAKDCQNAVEQRDPQKQYNPFTKAELMKLTPNINWDIYFTSIGIKTPENLVLNQPKFYEGLNTIINSISIADWKIYLKWKLLDAAAPYLSSKFVNESFKFNGTVLAGKKEMKPRYKRAQAATDEALGEVLGKVYVHKYFDSNSKKKVNEMVDNLIASYRVRINSRDWMSTGTKAQAQLKLDKIIKKLGFPDTWIDYKFLTIGKESYWKNVAAGRQFQYGRMLAKIGKPVLGLGAVMV
jgi:putative endopeptidase